MDGDEAMMIAGIGCRRGCPAEAIMALVREAGPVDALAAPEWKRAEPGLLEAARLLGLPLSFVGEAALAAVQGSCPTQSAVVTKATGLASVAEAAALAGGGVLVRARFGGGWATCAVGNLVCDANSLEGGVRRNTGLPEHRGQGGQGRNSGAALPGPLPRGGAGRGPAP